MTVVSPNSYYSSKIISKIQVILKKYSPNFTTRRVKTTKPLYMNNREPQIDITLSGIKIKKINREFYHYLGYTRVALFIRLTD